MPQKQVKTRQQASQQNDKLQAQHCLRLACRAIHTPCPSTPTTFEGKQNICMGNPACCFNLIDMRIDV